MKTPIEAIIDILEETPSQTITKENMLHILNNMLPTERQHLEDMTDAINQTLKSMGVRGISGKELFDRRYRGIVLNNPLV